VLAPQRTPKKSFRKRSDHANDDNDERWLILCACALLFFAPAALFICRSFNHYFSMCETVDLFFFILRQRGGQQADCDKKGTWFMPA
jgi:hypothetical protein